MQIIATHPAESFNKFENHIVYSEYLLAVNTLIHTIFFSCELHPAALSLGAGTGVLGWDHPVGLVFLGLPDIAEGDASHV